MSYNVLELFPFYDVNFTVVLSFFLCPSVQQTTSGIGHRVCVCCVCFPPIYYSGRQAACGRTSRGHTATGGRSHRISHPSSFCGACFNFSREKDPAVPFPRRP